MTSKRRLAQLARAGQKGGEATGPAKRRGSSEYYQELAAKAAAARARKAKAKRSRS